MEAYIGSKKAAVNKMFSVVDSGSDFSDSD
jgi:hypothetical protein